MASLGPIELRWLQQPAHSQCVPGTDTQNTKQDDTRQGRWAIWHHNMLEAHGKEVIVVTRQLAEIVYGSCEISANCGESFIMNL